MLTNIVAVVTIALATNVTEEFRQELVADNHNGASNTMGEAVFYGRWQDVANPREKWITTNVTEVHTLSFEYDGYKYAEFYPVPITNWTTHFEKLDGWTPSATNTPPPTSWIDYKP